MTNRNGKTPDPFTVRLEKATQSIWGSFVQALNETGCSHARAARSMRVTVNTVSNWVHGKTDVSVKRVMASRLLRGPFLNKLCVHGHDVPYVASGKVRR